ncbi:MAG: sulfatase-like hydrolase/transferase [Myxococcales bacterium]|nr:sulfatase-like hydrolase/transferase [Myxococcales bacterium]MDH3485847.1 sulfatase-like hydrolase/transferase [Myxococcales bacterium]
MTGFLSRAAICAISVALIWGCERSASDDVGSARPNVVVITIDTLRADRLGCYGYKPARTPHIDKLATQGVRVEHAIAPAPTTLPSHTTIFTGLEPPAHGVRDNASFLVPDEAVTLAERLKAEGYRTQAFVSAMVLHRMYNLHQGFDGYEDQLWREEQGEVFLNRERSGQRTMDLVLQWLDGPAASSKDAPFFLWVHLFDPHAPYVPPEEDAKASPTPYDGEIASVDRQVGRLMESLRRKKILDDTVLVFTSDHGESLGEHGEATHAVFIYESTVHVPLIVRYPRKLPAGKIYPGPARLVDVMPTILGLLELEPSATQGTDLGAPIAGTAPPPTFTQYSESLHPELEYGMAPLFGIRVGDLTYIRAPRPELYNRAKDPGETRNLLEPSAAKSDPAGASTAGAQAMELDHELTKTLAALERGALRPKAKPVDQDTVEMLRALGYVADPEAKKGLEGMDPKDGVQVYARLQNARQLFHDGDFAGCTALLEPLLATMPKNVSALNTAALCESKMGNGKAAERYYLRSLTADPRQHFALVELGRLQLAERRVDDARKSFQKALDVLPRSVEAMSLLGYLGLVLGNPDEARRWFDRAIAEDPTYAQSHIGYGDLYAAEQRYRQAKESYAKAAELQPRSFHAWFNGGLCALRLGEVQTAERYLIRAAEVDPKALLRNPNLAALQADPRLAGFRGALRRAMQNAEAAP